MPLKWGKLKKLKKGTIWVQFEPGTKRKKRKKIKVIKWSIFSPGCSSKLSRPLIKTEKTGKRERANCSLFSQPLSHHSQKQRRNIEQIIN